ncbi:Threonyl-tRNA synthetase [Streptococcus oralis]|uniref:Threonyl-tRNA synthetase n=1 Tax=Streptococcus oralis TaxID=1303 RepID=A0A139Q127_STROR|nr:Threonyl-tRNA synthetase [Streptococcus oralis]
MIKITFPDGAVREFESGVTTFEIAQSISNSLAKKALAGKFNGKLIDTTRAIIEDGSIEIVTPDHEDALPILRHSAAHLFAQAARRLFPDIHLGVGQLLKMASTTIPTIRLVKSPTKTFLVSKKKCKKSLKKTSHQSVKK